MNSITLLDTGVATLGVMPKIPQDANKITMGAECPECLKANIWHCANADTCGNNFDALKCYKDEKFLESIILPPGNWIILGWSDNLIQEKLWEIGILDYEAWALFLASNGITERKLILKQGI